MSYEKLHHEVLIAGFGGQGVVLAGRILAAAALSEGREVVWTPSYGPEMRGGAVHCTVIISSERIGSPEVSLADTLLIMDRASLGRFAARVKPGGLMILNSSLIPDYPNQEQCQVVRIPANEAAESIGEPRAANVIMLGAFLRARPVLSNDSVLAAMSELVGKGREKVIAVNREALERGGEIAAEVDS